jgi:hypothetical protein
LLLDYPDELKKAGVVHHRWDLRELNWDQQKLFFLKKNKYPFESFAGLFLQNKTDILFSKLKNKFLVPQNDDFIGEVIHAGKEDGLVIVCQRPQLWETLFRKNMVWEFVTPQGKVVKKKQRKIEDNEMIYRNDHGKELFLHLPYVKGLLPKTMIYFSKEGGSEDGRIS